MYPDQGMWDHIRIYIGSFSFILQQMVMSDEFVNTIKVYMKHAHGENKLAIATTYDRGTVEKIIDKVWADLKQPQADIKMLRYLKQSIIMTAAPKSGVVLEITDKHCQKYEVGYKYTPMPREQHQCDLPIRVKNVKELLEVIKINCRFIKVEDLK